uniref:CCHC-type domain-containing protein n=1 Tax=Caenorhabditis tropicalis TaxID=1561998 RepID=A0A1I7ULD7_9PELO
MEPHSKKTKEVSISASSSDNIHSVDSTSTSDSNNMASTSGALTQIQQSEPTHSSDDDIYFGRTTRLMWKAQTEQAAASHHSPKWNEPDTDYAPPMKKVKKEKNRDAGELPNISSVKDSAKKKKSLPASKPVKTPKSSKHAPEATTSHRSSASSSASHSLPSQPKATAPPPLASSQQQTVQKPNKAEDPIEPDLISGAQLDAKTLGALHTIREAATTSAQAAAIQDAINSVLSQSAPSPSQPNTVLPSIPYPPTQSLPAPVAVYPPAPVAPPPPPQPNVMPPNSELVAEQRHTFMIPPTDPLYNIIVSYYFGIKQFYNMAKNGDKEIMSKLRMDIEHEKFRRNELTESTQSTNNQIEELLASGVQTLKDRLNKLGMHSVTDVSELLAGSKQIVTQHKGLTTNVAHMENSVALEEQKLMRLGGPGALRCFEEAIMHPSVDIARLSDIVINNRDPNYVPQAFPEDSPIPDLKVSPTSRRPRQQKPRTTTSGNKRGNSAGRKSDGPTEDVEMEIQQFVQHALKVDNAVKEKERKARGNFLAVAERIP